MIERYRPALLGRPVQELPGHLTGHDKNGFQQIELSILRYGVAGKPLRKAMIFK